MTTTYVSARDALVTLIHNAWTTSYPAHPVFYENTLSIDLDTVSSPFLVVSVDFMDAVQSDLDMPDQGMQVFGEVCLRLFVKEGEGVREALEIIDFLVALMKMRDVSGVHARVPYLGRKQSDGGWVSQDLLCPFIYYSKF